MKTLGNVLWLLLCGIWMSAVYFIAGVLGMIFIITIPFGFQAFKLASYVLWPFGRTISRREDASGFWSLVGNILWILIGAWWLALIHLAIAVLFFITIVGIPFGVANVKLARLAITPFGLVVSDQNQTTGTTLLRVNQLGPTSTESIIT
jgi:uncharacterized membrane protein YccF (DUF307 family)